MAYKDSDELKADERYPLGDYSFQIERSSVPGSTNDKIEAICTDKDGKNARKSIQIPSSQNLEGYYVEANGTTADVYALVKVPTGDSEHTSPLVPGGVASSGNYQKNKTSESLEYYIFISGGSDGCTIAGPGQNRVTMLLASASQFTYRSGEIWPDGEEHNPGTGTGVSFIYDGKTVYYAYINTQSFDGADNPSMDPSHAAWTMIYGVPSGGGEYEIKEMLVGRFAIELEDAGGVGPGSDWYDPGDYDPDWEEGDPTHTLYVTVTGALSGRHNDPIEDPSYSYIPADKDTVKGYGCGGDGGHGGGGGAGASTVVVHKFATNQANSKEVTAIARRHGYGSGGGKGGKGGDGCILVYY